MDISNSCDVFGCSEVLNEVPHRKLVNGNSAYGAGHSILIKSVNLFSDRK